MGSTSDCATAPRTREAAGRDDPGRRHRRDGGRIARAAGRVREERVPCEVRFQHVDLPVVRPFVQVMGSVGAIDLLTIVGGVLFELSGG